MSTFSASGPLLKAVSRTFYLSVRMLPRALREPVGLAYLLARTSDTIADVETTAPQTRLRRLGDFEGLLRGLPSPHGVAAIQRDIQPQHAGEKALIAALPQVLQAFGNLDAWQWTTTSELLANIIRGQGNDLEIFRDSSAVIALPDAAALEDYIYLVAGCVGEWWTRMCFHHLPGYSRVPEAELMPLAGAFGKALQLVNVLRDFPADVAAGRCYLPADELLESGADPATLREDLTPAQAVFDNWLAKARILLEQGRLYIAAVRTRRVRMACYLPWKLAGKTLDLLESRNPLLAGERIKVTRGAVRGAWWSSLRVAFSNKALMQS